jgi:hypothetical protein
MMISSLTFATAFCCVAVSTASFPFAVDAVFGAVDADAAVVLAFVARGCLGSGFFGSSD